MAQISQSSLALLFSVLVVGQFFAVIRADLAAPVPAAVYEPEPDDDDINQREDRARRGIDLSNLHNNLPNLSNINLPNMPNISSQAKKTAVIGAGVGVLSGLAAAAGAHYYQRYQQNKQNATVEATTNATTTD